MTNAATPPSPPPSAAEDPPPPPAEALARDARVMEALLFAATEPLCLQDLADRLSPGQDATAVLAHLATQYAGRGVVLVETGGRWAFRTAPDLAPLLRIDQPDPRRLSRAGLETLAIIAYHQPVTRAEIEDIRGVAVSRGTLDQLMDAGWVRPLGRRQTVGRPLTWGTTNAFLDHFSLARLEDLPGLDDLKAAGLLDARPALAAYGARADGSDDALEDVEHSGTLTGQPGRHDDAEAQWDLLRRPPAAPDEATD